ncbi:helix-turn-helix transcriptional regulator [Lactobacillus acetotolerans]|uniref:helix-turn-helix transcriptional regulator n=1 Tax=Lactobacillus acetotolerans TaxID=1600 RepID=UPI002FD949AC
MNVLRKARINHKLTQAEAAQSIGISLSMLAKMEMGIKKPSYETMKKVAAFYHMTVDELFFATNSH